MTLTAPVETGEDDPQSPARRRHNKLLAFGIAIVLTVLVMAFFGEMIVPYDPTVPTFDISVPPPPIGEWPGLLWSTLRGDLDQPVHWFGTDSSGLDVFSRVIASSRADLVIALSATGVSAVLGVILGIFTGFFRNMFTEFIVRVSDVLQSFPVFISAMILVSLAGRSYLNIILALTLVYTPIYLRLTRSEVLSQASRGFIQAAQALGNTKLQTAWKHVLPNALGPAIIQSSVTIGFAILLTAGLSFVGAGIRPPQPEWGLMISAGAGGIVLGEWWSSVFPGLAISLTVFGFAVIGNELEARYER